MMARIRMDCSSPYAMARLVGLKDRYRGRFATDPDADRYGIVTPTAGLLNPNHYLAVAIRYYLLTHANGPHRAAVGKTLVSSGMIDRVVKKFGRASVRSPGGLQMVYERAFSRARYASVARRAPGQAFYGSTERRGRLTKMA